METMAFVPLCNLNFQTYETKDIFKQTLVDKMTHQKENKNTESCIVSLSTYLKLKTYFVIKKKTWGAYTIFVMNILTIFTLYSLILLYMSFFLFDYFWFYCQFIAFYVQLRNCSSQVLILLATVPQLYVPALNKKYNNFSAIFKFVMIEQIELK